MLTTTHNLSTTRCPSCGVIVDAATNATGDGAPNEDDYSVCFTCGTVCRYNADLSLRVASPDDHAYLRQQQPEEYKTLLHVTQEIKRFRLQQVKEN